MLRVNIIKILQNKSRDTCILLSRYVIRALKVEKKQSRVTRRAIPEFRSTG